MLIKIPVIDGMGSEILLWYKESMTGFSVVPPTDTVKYSIVVLLDEGDDGVVTLLNWDALMGETSDFTLSLPAKGSVRISIVSDQDGEFKVRAW